MKFADALKQERQLGKRITTARMAGRSRDVKQQVRRYLASYPAKIIAAYEVNQHFPSKNKLSRQDLHSRAEAINVWATSGEPVWVRRQTKKTGGYRYIQSFGIENRIRQTLVKNALSYACEPHPRQYAVAKGRGREKACRAVIKALESSNHWVSEIDIQSCFPSLKVGGVSNLLPLPYGVVERVVMASDYNLAMKHVKNALGHLQAARQGIPQGSTASNLVSEIILAPIAAAGPDTTEVVMYSDNVLALAKTKGEVESIVQTLRSALESHPAGPLKPRVTGPQHATDGFTFLGYRFCWNDDNVQIIPSIENLEWLRLRVDEHLGAIEYSGPEAEKLAALARRSIESWAKSFRLAKLAEFRKTLALLEIEEALELERRLTAMGYPYSDPPI